MGVVVVGGGGGWWVAQALVVQAPVPWQAHRRWQLAPGGRGGSQPVGGSGSRARPPPHLKAAWQKTMKSEAGMHSARMVQ